MLTTEGQYNGGMGASHELSLGESSYNGIVSSGGVANVTIPQLHRTMAELGELSENLSPSPRR
jgi:hypothetical protein